jgi:NAD(P)H-quinone oxidoreductase subunit 5
MMSIASLEVLVLIGIGTPAGLLLVLALTSLLNRPLLERWTGRLAAGAMIVSCLAIGSALLLYGAAGAGTVLISYGYWSTAHEGGIAIEFLLDGLSLAFATLTTAIAGVVSAFSNRYLHREPGYNRYFVLFAMFVTGMLLVALAGNVEVLFAGWELVGLSSALLVAFFHERPAPAANALRVFSVYRISDAAMLSAT